MTNKLRNMLLAMLMVGLSSLAEADLYVIVNKNNAVQQLDKKQLVDLYMGRLSFFSTGARVLTIDLASDDKNREVFYRVLIDKSVSEVNAYWARLLFTGRATPPFRVDSEQEVINFIKNNDSAIGYVSKAALTPSVKVVYVIKNVLAQ